MIFGRWLENRQQILKELKAKRLLRERLVKNWTELLKSDWVGGLSHMPEDWKSGIVPVRSKTGEALNMQLQKLAKKIEIVSTNWHCYGGQRRRLALKSKLSNLMAMEVAPFFESRDQMYVSNLTTKTTGAKTEGVEIKTAGPTSRSKRRMTEGIRPWPEKSNALTRQIMFLLRELDNMFKASYNQRYDLRILQDERTAYQQWMENQLPQLMPHKFVLAQNTSHIFELFCQAAKVHSYYNSVCKHIAKETKAEWHAAPLKKIFRILEKAEHVQLNDGGSVQFNCSNIFDIVRGTLVYDKLGDVDGGVLRGIRTLFQCPQLQIIRVKDRFNNPTSACWRDVLCNARMVSSQGNIISHIVEIQLHQRDLRDERMNVGGHFIYERHRALFEACETAFGDEASEKLKDLHANCEVAVPATRDMVRNENLRKAMKHFSSSRVHPQP